MNMVLDASALLAFIHHERGDDKVEKIIVNKAVISSVNWAEVAQKAQAQNINVDNLFYDLVELGLSYVSFNINQARIAANLWQYTKIYGLSLGDRACLALAIELNLPVLTADKIWKQLDIGVDIQLVRDGE